MWILTLWVKNSSCIETNIPQRMSIDFVRGKIRLQIFFSRQMPHYHTDYGWVLASWDTKTHPLLEYCCILAWEKVGLQ